MAEALMLLDLGAKGGLACGRALAGAGGHGLAAAVQSRMEEANFARVMEKDETATSALPFREAF
jgi:hypothetical protein